MNTQLQLTVVAVFLSLLIFLRRKKKTRKLKNTRTNKKEAPTVRGGWPMMGHLHLLGGDNQLLYRTLGAMADEYGPAFTMWLGSRRAFVVSSWEVAKQCFTTNDRALASRPTTVAAKHMGYNHAVFGFAPYTPFWREMRKIATLELLSNRRLEMLKHVRVSEVEMGVRELYESWVQSGSSGSVLVELNRWFEELTLNVVVRMVAGKRYEDEAGRCQKAISEFFHLIGIFVVSDAIPWLGWLDVKGHERAMKKTAKDLDVILESWLQEHRQNRARGEVKTEGQQDFIDVMLSLQDQGHLSNFLYDPDTSIKSTCLVCLSLSL